MSKRLRILLLILTMEIVAAMLVFSFRWKQVDLSDALRALRTARWRFLPLGILIGLMVFPIKAWRWRIILGPSHTVRFRTLLSAIMIGFMVNCIFSRIGEIVRAAVLGLKKEAPTSTALASIALERIFDLVSVMCFLVVGLLWLGPARAGADPAALAKVRLAGLLGAVVFLLGVLFLVLLRLKPRHTTRLLLLAVAWMPRRLHHRVQTFLQSFLNGLNAIKSLRQVLVLLALSLAHWSVQVLFFFAIALCLPELGLSLPGAMVVFGVSALGVGAVPLPGYLGVYQLSIGLAGAIMALPPSHLVNYEWLTWAANIPVIIAAGFICLWIEGLTLGQLRAGAQPPSPAP